MRLFRETRLEIFSMELEQWKNSTTASVQSASFGLVGNPNDIQHTIIPKYEGSRQDFKHDRRKSRGRVTCKFQLRWPVFGWKLKASTNEAIVFPESKGKHILGERTEVAWFCFMMSLEWLRCMSRCAFTNTGVWFFLRQIFGHFHDGKEKAGNKVESQELVPRRRNSHNTCL